MELLKLNPKTHESKWNLFIKKISNQLFNQLNLIETNISISIIFGRYSEADTSIKTNNIARKRVIKIVKLCIQTKIDSLDLENALNIAKHYNLSSKSIEKIKQKSNKIKKIRQKTLTTRTRKNI